MRATLSRKGGGEAHELPAPGEATARERENMTEWALEAAPRQARGKGGARQLRREGLVPGIVYGLKDPMTVQVNAHDAALLMHRLHGVSRIVTLRVAHEKGAAHEWNVDEARLAGRKGGTARHSRRKEMIVPRLEENVEQVENWSDV